MSDAITRPSAMRPIGVPTGKQDLLPHLPKSHASGYAGTTQVHQCRRAQPHHATLALVSASVGEALARRDATMAVARWRQLKRVRRYVQPWPEYSEGTGRWYERAPSGRPAHRRR